MHCGELLDRNSARGGVRMIGTLNAAVLTVGISPPLRNLPHTELQTVNCLTGAEALAQIRTKRSYRGVFCYFRLPDIDAMRLVRILHNEFPELPVVIVTEPQDIKWGILGMISGASDFIQTPLNANVLCASLERALTRRCIEPDAVNSRIRRRQGRSPSV